jgi:hypothetical protein
MGRSNPGLMRYCPEICLVRLSKTIKTLRKSGALADILTEYLLNTECRALAPLGRSRKIR